MQEIRTVQDLSVAIQILEIQKTKDFSKIKDHITSEIKNFEPLTLLKNQIADKIKSPDFMSNLFDASLGLATGYIAKKIILSTSSNPVVKLAGFVVQLATANAVNNNATEIKSKIGTIFTTLWNNYRDLKRAKNTGLQNQMFI